MNDKSFTEESLDLFLRMKREKGQEREPTNDLEQKAKSEEEEDGWTSDDFEEFLFSSFNDVVDEDVLNYPDDLTQPLCHYFISSSHNTYLTGGQYAVTGGR